MIRRLSLSLFLLATLRIAAAENLGYWTVHALGTVTYYRQQIDRGAPIRVLALHRGAPIRRPSLDVPELDVVDVLDAADPATTLDLYARISGAYDRRPFECIVISGLATAEVVTVEQFVRHQHRAQHRIAIVATTTDVRSAPFAVTKDNVAYARLQALKSYGLLDGAPRAGATIIDRTPVQPGYRTWVHCIPRTPRDGETVSDEGVCYRNAIARRNATARPAWEEAIGDLAVAIMLDPKEAVDKVIYKRGWGYERYFPRLGLADFLSRLGDCNAVHRELDDPDSKSDAAMRRDVYARCPRRTSLLFVDPQLGAIPSELGRAAGDAELLPPFAPRIAWSDIALF